MLKEGDKVPDGLTGILVVKSENGFAEKKVSLKELWKNKIVLLYFYPKDMTSGCITEAITFQQYLPQFELHKVRVIGCSRDSVKSHCSFLEKKSLAFELLSDSVDSKGQITDAFGVWAEKSMYGKKYMGIIRSTFIIEKGKIIKVFARVKVKDHAIEVLDFLRNR